MAGVGLDKAEMRGIQPDSVPSFLLAVFRHITPSGGWLYELFVLAGRTTEDALWPDLVRRKLAI